MTNFQKILTDIVNQEPNGQKGVAEKLGIEPAYVSMLKGGKRKLSDDLAKVFAQQYGYDADELIRIQSMERLGLGSDDFLSHLQDPEPKINPTTKDALNNLKKIQAQKENIKPKNYDEGYYNEDDFVNTKRTVVTIKGFAGLQNAFFPDDYIDKHFTTEIVKVPKEDAGKHFYRIQVKENNYSMYPKIKPLDWTDCVEISKDEWNSPNIYKKDKVYCFWHPIKGILFKFAKLTNEDKIIELFSLNEDRIEYPNEKFNLLEFKKIMCVEYIIQKA